MSLEFEPVEKNNTNPKYIGPGTWNVIHTLAYNAKTKEDKECFIKQMNLICKQFPCETCRGHCKQYIKENPMEDYLNVVTEGKKLGLFTWTWKFHNAVNFRIGKPNLSWEMALHIYSQYKVNHTEKEIKSGGVCSLECSDPDKSKHKKDKNDKNVKKPLYKIDKEERYYQTHKLKKYNEL